MKTRHGSPDLFNDLAEAIADGSAVDWDALRERQTDLPPEIANLRALERLAEVCRAGQVVGLDGDDPGGVPAAKEPVLADSPPLFTWGPLRVLEKIDEGGFGEVYRAFDPFLQIEVALKLCRLDVAGDSDTVRGFLAEARALAGVRHANILAVYGAEVHDGRVGLWTEFVRGKTLADIVREQGPYSADEAVRAGIDLCAALAALHTAGLVHRDLKPANVMREEGGRIVLMDLGSADRHRPPAGNRGEAPVRATPLTAAPEILLSGARPTPASDVYSLGVLLYWLVSDSYPVEAESLAQLCEKHRRGERRGLLDLRPNLSPDYVLVVERALAPDVGRRYASAGEMQRALLSVLRGSRARSTPWWPVAAGVLALAVAFAGFALLRAPSSPLEVEAALYRTNGPKHEPLPDGGGIERGDGLYLEIQGSHPAHVYVLSEEDAGPVTVLFPADTDKHNPLPARIQQRLPGKLDGEEYTWVVTSQGREEAILVVASLDPLPALERRLAGYGHASPDHQVEPVMPSPHDGSLAGPEEGGPERGIRGLGPEHPSATRQGDGELAQMARELTEMAENSRGVWVRTFKLRYHSE